MSNLAVVLRTVLCSVALTVEYGVVYGKSLVCASRVSRDQRSAEKSLRDFNLSSPSTRSVYSSVSQPASQSRSIQFLAVYGLIDL